MQDRLPPISITRLEWTRGYRNGFSEQGPRLLLSESLGVPPSSHCKFRTLRVVWEHVEEDGFYGAMNESKMWKAGIFEMEVLLRRMALGGGIKKQGSVLHNRSDSIAQRAKLPPMVTAPVPWKCINKAPRLHMIPLKIFCPFSNFSMRSFRNCRCLFNAGGSEAIFSTSESDKLLTTTGEKIFSRPRIMWRSTTWVVTFATNTLSKTWTNGRQLKSG